MYFDSIITYMYLIHKVVSYWSTVTPNKIQASSKRNQEMSEPYIIVNMIQSHYFPTNLSFKLGNHSHNSTPATVTNACGNITKCSKFLHLNI